MPSCTPHPGDPKQEEDTTYYYDTVLVYTVQSDGCLRPTPTGSTAQAWQEVEQIMTPAFAGATLTELRVAQLPDATIAGFVTPESGNARWSLTINLGAVTDPSQLTGVLIHEYGHLLTLSATQQSPSAYSVADGTATLACTTVITLQDGCALDDSYLAAWYQQFWTPYGASAPSAENVSADIGNSWYQAHSGDFVDQYAATNPFEDIAESFMAYVLDDSAASGTAQAKLAFFDHYPELATVRAQIRATFAGTLPDFESVAHSTAGG